MRYEDFLKDMVINEELLKDKLFTRFEVKCLSNKFIINFLNRLIIKRANDYRKKLFYQYDEN